MKSYLSISEAADVQKVTRQAIYFAVREKKLKVHKLDGKCVFTMEDLKEYETKKYSRLYHAKHNGKKIFNENKGNTTVARASKMINLPKQRIYYAIRTGALKAQRKHTSWVININGLMKFHQRISRRKAS